MPNEYTANLKRILIEADDFSVVCEIYAADAAPPFNPNTALKRYSQSGENEARINFFGADYTRLVRSFGTTRRTVTAEVNSVSVDFDNLSREISDFELAGVGFEGLIMVVRLISRRQSVLLSDGLIIFVGRCEKPKSGTREKMQVSARHILGGTDAEIPRRKFSPDDPEGRHPSDILFEGFRFTPQYGVATYSTREKRGGFFGLFGLKKTVTHTVNYSSYSDLDASKYLPEGFGRVQVIGTHLAYLDLGTLIRMTTAFLEGEVAAFSNLRVVTAPFFASFIPYFLFGKLGGVGGQLPYNVDNYPGNGHYSRTALVFSAAGGTTVQSNDAAPDLVSVILGRKMTVPDAAGAWTGFDWTDDGAAQTRFCLTSPDYYKLAPAWIDDASFLEVFNFNKEIIFDSSYSDTLFTPPSFASLNPTAAALFLRSTAVCSPEYFQYLNKTKTIEQTFLLPPKMATYDSVIQPIEVDPGGGGGGGGEENPTANLYFFLRRRYVSNVVVTESMKLIDFLHKILFPASRMFFSQNAAGQIKLNSKKPVDFALGTAAFSGSVIALDDVSKWISDKSGQLLIDPNTAQSEVRGVTGASYSIGGNSVALTASANITIDRAFSGADGANIPATARLIVASNTPNCSFSLDGIAIPFTAGGGDTINSIAGFIFAAIGGHPTLSRKFAAAWNPNSATVNLTAKFGTLQTDSALQLLHAAPLANPTAAPVPTATAAGLLNAGIYKIAYAFADGRGQTLLSPFSDVTLTANQKISIAAITPPAGAQVVWYCSPAAGSRQLRFVRRNTGAAFIIDVLPKVSAALSPDLNRTGTEVLRVAQVFSDRAETRSNIGKSNVLKATFEFQPERKNAINQVEVTFRDSTQDFRLSRIILRDDEHIAKTKKVSKLEVNCQAIDGYHQAYRIAAGLLAENRDADFFYKWAADREALLLEEGAVCCITDSGSGVYNLPVRIEEIGIAAEKGFPTATFNARKYSTSLYDDAVAERQIPVIVETGSIAAITAARALYTYVPANFTANRSLNLNTATVGDIANAIATVMDDLENGRK